MRLDAIYGRRNLTMIIKEISFCNFEFQQCIALICCIPRKQAFQGVKSSGLYTEKYGSYFISGFGVGIIFTQYGNNLFFYRYKYL